MIRFKKGYSVLTCLFAVAGLLSACAASKNTTDENLLGIPNEDSDKLMITITCNSKLPNFAAAIEERFPHIQLIQDCYTGQYRISEHIAQVEHDDLGDIVMVKAGHIPQIDMSEQLLDLSVQAFPARFNTHVLQSDEDGHITLIPGPLSFNCNIYNKTLFEEHNWTVPDNYEDFLELCQEIDKTGIRGFRNSYFDSASQSYQIYQYTVFSALDTLTQVEGQAWHNKLIEGEKVSLEPMGTAFEDLQRMIDIGVVRKEDMDVSFEMNMESMINREVAIGSGEIDHIQKLNGNSTDEFCFMPHYSMADKQSWILNLGYFFGANKKLQQPENEEKLKAVMDIMNFIASEEGQNVLVEDGIGIMPATIGAKIPDNPVLEQVHTEIMSGRYIMRPTYDMFTSVLETEIAAFIRGETDSQAILDKCSQILRQGVPSPQALGEAAEDFTVLQTGCLKADALRAAADTDIALIGLSEVNGYDPVGGTRAKLYKGAVTEDDINRIAQSKMDKPFMSERISVTGKELLSLLEYGATSEKEQQDGKVSSFHPFAVSGLKVSYHLEEEEGKRISDVMLEDGSQLQLDKIYTLSYIKGAFPKKNSEGKETGITLTDALRDYIAAQKNVVPARERVSYK